jgi:hypothetical protein
MGMACRMHRRQTIYTQNFGCKNLRKKDHLKSLSIDVRIISKSILTLLLPAILMVAEFLTYSLSHKQYTKILFKKNRIVIAYVYQHTHINCITLKLQIIHTHESSYMFQG